MQIGGEGIDNLIGNIVLIFFWKDNMKKHLSMHLYLGMG
jgi:hypothetical protein